MRSRESGIDGIEQLKLQHEHLLEAFDELEVTVEPEARLRLFAHIGQRLKAHAAVEEEVFHPGVESAGISAEAVSDAAEAHVVMDVLLDEILGAEAKPATVKLLRDVVERHFNEEEEHLFAFVQRLPESVRKALANAIQAYLDEFGDGAEDSLPPP
ncbi:MAG: hemerythrin domain-containing protein [Candidatus Binatia bacterium]